MGAALAARVKLDGWQNVLTRLGTPDDKATAAQFYQQAPLTYEVCESLFSFDDLAHTICAQIVLDAMGSGFELARAADSDDEQAQADEQAANICRRLRELGCYQHLGDASIWGRTFGGGAILLGLEGSGEFSEPVKKDSKNRILGKLRYLRTCTKRELTIATRNDRGEPETYSYTPFAVDGQQHGAMVVHASRLLVFRGARTAPLAKAANQGWDLSILDRVWTKLQASNTKWSSVTHMFTDMSQAVFRLQGLISGLASDEDTGLIETRVRLLDKLRSVARAVVLDAGRQGEPGESYELVERGAMTGLSELLKDDLVMLAAAARMPVCILLGQSPAGLNATGEADLQHWHKNVGTHRTLELEPPAMVLVSLVAGELGYDFEGWEIVWPALWQQSDKEKAETSECKVRTATALINAQVVHPEEVALSLPKIFPDVEIDRESRHAMLETAIEQDMNPSEPDDSSFEKEEPGSGAGGEDKPRPEASEKDNQNAE